MVTELPNAYDEVPYEDGCYPFTHPDHLATLGVVHGLPVPALEECRVLELGCARGGNLLPMALEHPAGKFVGVDLSARQIADANALVERLGLRNVEFRKMDLADVDRDFGEFDYVVCHGVYSWVPEPVRDRILAICAGNLSPRGLACVSYNTFPGWSARGMVRDVLRFHARGAASPAEQVERSRGFLEELAVVLPSPSSAYASILRSEGQRLGDAADSYVVHEVFEEDNRPCSVLEFLGRAGAAGLEFVAEALSPGLLVGLPGPAQAAIGRWADDRPAREQYLDLVVNRAFRRSILRRAGGGVVPRDPSPETVEGLVVLSSVVPAVPGADAAADEPLEFSHPGRVGAVTTNNPFVKAALLALHDRRSRPLAFEELCREVRERLARGGRTAPAAEEDVRRVLRESLLRLFLTGLVELHLRPPRFAVEVPRRPVASPLARLQAGEGTVVTSLRRKPVRLDEAARVVLLKLDGSRTEEDVLEAIVADVASGALELSGGPGPLREERAVREALAGEIGPALDRLCRAALLAE